MVYAYQDPVGLQFRGWGEVSAGARGAVRAVFPPALPYLHEEF